MALRDHPRRRAERDISSRGRQRHDRGEWSADSVSGSQWRSYRCIRGRQCADRRSRGRPCCAPVSFNETTGGGSINSTSKSARRMLTAGAVGALAAVAIVLTTVLAARGESRLSANTVLHVPIYLVSITVSSAILLFSCTMFAISVHMRKVCALMRFVADGR